MKKKLGFTLIELLAVIVILAIIALISTPIVMNIISNYKEQANIRSAENYMRAIELAILDAKMNREKIEDGTYSIDNLPVTVNVNLPDIGYINIVNGKVDSYNVLVNNQIVDVSNNGSEASEYIVWQSNETSSVTPVEQIYRINNPKELAWIASTTNSGTTYEGMIISLDSNLDLNNIEWVPIGTADHPFMGTFEGNGHTIKNMKINLSSSSNVGLFGCITNANIKNVIITNSNITGYASVGALVGRNNTSEIDNCISYSNKISTNSNNVGSIVGRNGGTIKNSKSINDNISALAQVGGIAGWIGDSTIENCYSNSFVTGEYAVGGIVGISSPTRDNNVIKNVVSKATVVAYFDSYDSTEAGGTVGGVIGGCYGGYNISNATSYANVEGYSLVGGIAGKTVSNAGYTGRIDNVHSYSNILVKIEYAGGLFGLFNGELTNSSDSSIIRSENDVKEIGGLTYKVLYSTISDVLISTIINGVKVTNDNIIKIYDGTNSISNVTIK